MKAGQALYTPMEFPPLLKKWRKFRRLSQLDFSLKAGISQRHLSFLESGRSKPSRSMVVLLSKALDLPLRDHNHMLNAAGFTHKFKQRSLDNLEMKMVYEALQMNLQHHEPYPAIVVDRNWDLVLANNAALNLVNLLENPSQAWDLADPSGKKNIYRMTFSTHGFRPIIANWRALSSHLLSRLQRELSLYPENEALSILFDELNAELGFSADIHESLYEPKAPILPMHIKTRGFDLKMFSMISSFGTALDVTAEELKVETFYPADEFSKSFLSQSTNKCHG